jgi:lipoate-protein ligase A
MVMGGAWQMAIDAWLLDQSLAGAGSRAGCVVRLYQWSRPTLSLGLHQRRIPPHWWRMVRQGEIEMVRRPSGGRAVLHAGDLTYALIWPGAPPRREQAYRQACGWLQEAFLGLDLPLRFGRLKVSTQGSSCFATGTAADLVHPDGAKRIGSAQFWRQGCLLQHGTILIAPPARLWWSLFGHAPPPLPPLPLSTDELQERLRRAAWSHFPPIESGVPAGHGWTIAPLSAAELACAKAELERFGPLQEPGSPP